MVSQPKHHVVEIFLPLTTNSGERFRRETFERIRKELLHRFGGVTFFSRSPAEGLWIQEGESPTQDEIVVVEVLVEQLEPEWWARYRRKLEVDLDQKEVLVRSYEVLKL
jgi:hypothetical protein